LLQSRGLASLVKRPGVLRRDAGTRRIFADMLAAVADGIETLTSDGLRPVELALLEFFASCMVEETSEDGLRGETGTQMSIPEPHLPDRRGASRRGRLQPLHGRTQGRHLRALRAAAVRECRPTRSAIICGVGGSNAAGWI